MKIKDRETNEIIIAVYGANRKGNMRYNVDGKFLTDKQFNKQFVLVNDIYMCECGWSGLESELIHRDIFDEQTECDQFECPNCLNVIINNLQ